MNTRKNNAFFRHISLLVLIVYSVSIVAFVPPKVSAQEKVTRESRLTISLGSARIQLEQKDGQLTQKLLMHDYLSSTKVVVSESGEVSTYPSYYPYGSSIAQTPTSMTDKQYTGQRKVSDDSSVYNYNARYYNPTSALFIQPDSVRGPGRYTYVSGNPIQGTDPSGHDVCQQDKSLAFLWKAVGQCGGAEGEDFMGEEGLGSVGTVMAAAEAASGGIGGIAAAIGDKITDSTSGSESVSSAYASLSGGAGAGILAMGMISPDPGDVGRGASLGKRILDKLFRNEASVVTKLASTGDTLKAIREDAFQQLQKLHPSRPLAGLSEYSNNPQRVTKALLSELGLTEDSRMYRWTKPKYVDPQRGLAIANRGSVAGIRDEYTYGINPMLRGITVGQAAQYGAGMTLHPRYLPAGSLLNMPSLNVMPTVNMSYAQPGRVLISFRLGDALAQGGRIYRDTDSAISAAKPLLISIPQGCVACRIER